MAQAPSEIFNQLLEDWHAGDHEALRAALPLVYEELRQIAHNRLRQERADHTLQSTALVHEAYLRLEKQGAAKIENRANCVSLAVKSIGKPDARNGHVRFDERG